MKVLLNIVAAAFITAGLLVAVVSIVVPGQVILGIDVRLAATLLTGGFVLLALAKALELLEVMSRELRRLTTTEAEPPWLKESAAAAAPLPAAAPASAEPARRRSGEPPREAVEPRWRRAAGSPTPSAREHEAPTPPLATATPMPEPEPELEPDPEPEPIPQANQRLEPAPTLEPAEPEVPKNADTPAGVEASELKPSEDSADEKEPPELYVVEERRFRGKQARVLSDGTIEAETEEGWMRFEDMEHLREYLDATIGPRR